MNSSEEQKGAATPPTGSVPSTGETATGHNPKEYDDGYPHEPDNESSATVSAPPIPPVAEPGTKAVARTANSSGGGKTPPVPPSGGSDGDDEDDRMLRMSFLEHLEELRARIIRALIGVGVAFAVSIFFTDQLWTFVTEPAMAAL